MSDQTDANPIVDEYFLKAIGQQRGPASVAQVEAQAKQAGREVAQVGSDVQITWHTREEAAQWPEGIVVLMLREKPAGHYALTEYWRPDWCANGLSYLRVAKFARLDTREYDSHE